MGMMSTTDYQNAFSKVFKNPDDSISYEVLEALKKTEGVNVERHVRSAATEFKRDNDRRIRDDRDIAN
ncbi:6361_t:CDS:1, partial [Acaulospora colombiana]